MPVTIQRAHVKRDMCCRLKLFGFMVLFDLALCHWQPVVQEDAIKNTNSRCYMLLILSKEIQVCIVFLS